MQGTDGGAGESHPNRISSLLAERPHLVLAGILVMAAVLTFFRLGHKSFWLDEVTSAELARLDASHMWDIITSTQLNMSPYYGLLHLWIKIDDGEFFIRSLSLIFALATIPTVYALVSRLFSQAAGLICAFLIVINSFFIQYAQEARAYSMALFLVTLSTYLLIRALEDPARRWWIGYVAVSALAVYAHFFSIFVLTAHVGALAFFPRARLPLRQVLFGFVGIAVLLVPFAIFLRTGDQGQIGWIEEPTPVLLARALQRLVGQNGYLLVGVYALLGVMGAAALFVAWRKRGMESWKLVLVAGWVVIPILGSFVLSYAKPIFNSRYLIVALPAVAIIAALGILNLRLAAGSIALAVVLVLSAQGLLHWYRDYKKENWRGATRYVVENAQSGDGITFFFVRVRKPFEYYLRRTDSFAEAPEPVYPAIEWGDPAGFNVEVQPSSDIEKGVATIDPERYERLWVVFSHVDDRKRAFVERLLEEKYSEIDGRRFPFIRVKLFAAQPALGP